MMPVKRTGSDVAISSSIMRSTVVHLDHATD